MAEQPKVVYGYMTDQGDGIEHLWHLGVFLNEDDAFEAWDNMPASVWIEAIDIKSSGSKV